MTKKRKRSGKGGRKGARPGARLGQHFLKGTHYAKSLARSVHIKHNEIVVEIGPGKGVLTKEILAEGGRVIAIEKDEALVSLLNETFTGDIARGMLKIMSADIRDIVPADIGLRPGGYVVAANIPYYITGEIIRQFLTASAPPRALALLIQKEVAQRITAQKQSILSLSVKAFGVPKIVEKVPRKYFSPPPSVDSAILLIDGVSRDFFSDVDEDRFFNIVRAGFGSKRKYLSNNLSICGKERVAEAFKTLDISEKARAEDIGLTQWKQLTQLLYD